MYIYIYNFFFYLTRILHPPEKEAVGRSLLLGGDISIDRDIEMCVHS